MKLSHIITATVFVLAASTLTRAQTNSLCSITSSGALGNASSGSDVAPAVSNDGRWVAFDSFATNFVAGDTNQSADVFAHDRQTGITVCVSVDPSGVPGNHLSNLGGISGDGRFVTFWSGASNLVASDTNNNFDVFVRDLQNSTTELISVSSLGVQGNAGSLDPSISADGRYVAFSSSASNFIPGGDANANGRDIFIRDRVAGTTTLASLTSIGTQTLQGECDSPAISADGQHVAFVSIAGDLVPGDTNHAVDVFVRDLVNGTTTRVSVSSSGAEANGPSLHPSLSGDGRFVAFESRATNLVPFDTNGVTDVFVHDVVTGATRRVSVTSSGAQGNAMSTLPMISGDGQWVTFQSDATNLVPHDVHFARDVFLHDMASGATMLGALTFAGTQPLNGAWNPAISSDGRYLAFASFSPDIVLNGSSTTFQVYLTDREPSVFSSCAGDGTTAPCPCGNSGAPGYGCDNSVAGVLGAKLTGGGVPSLSADTMNFGIDTDIPLNLCIVMQGDATIAPAAFGDGLRCVAGTLLRLFSADTASQTSFCPGSSGTTISARSAALGDVIAPGSARHYQAYYRDPSATFCARPAGDTFNITSALSVTWLP